MEKQPIRCQSKDCRKKAVAIVSLMSLKKVILSSHCCAKHANETVYGKPDTLTNYENDNPVSEYKVWFLD